MDRGVARPADGHEVGGIASCAAVLDRPAMVDGSASWPQFSPVERPFSQRGWANRYAARLARHGFGL
jgi:hypothetical protein